MNLRGKTAVVTGGALRIGRAIVEALARAEARVVIHFHTSRPEALALADHLRAAQCDAFTIPADLADADSCSRLIERAGALAGAPVDMLVNNAAVFHKDSFQTLTAGGLRDELAINLTAPVLLMQAMAAQKHPGRIVNVLDRRVTGLDPSCVPYSLAKQALEHATRLAALALAPDVTVNAVAPGPCLPPSKAAGDSVHDRMGFIPLGKPCPPEAVAEAVIFLLQSDHLTGQCIFVDGGQHLLGDPQRYRPEK